MSSSDREPVNRDAPSMPEIPDQVPKAKSKRAGDGQNVSVEIRLPKEDIELKFDVAAGATGGPCKLISFLSPKGGSGKTVLASNLGKILQLSGYNVLLLDADFATKSLTNLIFPGRKVIAEGLTSYYNGLLGIDGVDLNSWLTGIL